MISVIMLTYNRCGCVENMISDILEQSLIDFEFIIINNGSTDNTDMILNQYADRDSRIQIIKTNAVSVGCGRNMGIRKSTGEYIAFVDDDDRVTADYLEFLYKLILEEQGDIAICGTAEDWDGKIVPQCQFDNKLILSAKEGVGELLKREKIRAGTPGKLIKRSLLEKNLFKEDCVHEDIHTIYKYIAESEKIVLHGMVKYFVGRSGNNLSFFTSDASQWTEDKMKEYYFAFQNRAEYLKEKLPEVYHLAQYSLWSYMLSMIDKINIYGLEGCEKISRIFLTELLSHQKEFLASPYIKSFEKEWFERYYK